MPFSVRSRGLSLSLFEELTLPNRIQLCPILGVVCVNKTKRDGTVRPYTQSYSHSKHNKMTKIFFGGMVFLLFPLWVKAVLTSWYQIELGSRPKNIAKAG